MSKTNKKSIYKRFEDLTITRRITLLYGGIFSLSLLVLSGFFFVNITILEQNNTRKQLESTISNIEHFLDNGGNLTNDTLKTLLDNKYVEVSIFSYSENAGFYSHVGEIPSFIKEPPQDLQHVLNPKNVVDTLWSKQDTHKKAAEYHIRSLKELGINRQEFIMFQPENPWSLDRGMNGARYRIYIY